MFKLLMMMSLYWLMVRILWHDYVKTLCTRVDYIINAIYLFFLQIVVCIMFGINVVWFIALFLPIAENSVAVMGSLLLVGPFTILW